MAHATYSSRRPPEPHHSTPRANTTRPPLRAHAAHMKHIIRERTDERHARECATILLSGRQRARARSARFRAERALELGGFFVRTQACSVCVCVLAALRWGRVGSLRCVNVDASHEPTHTLYQPGVVVPFGTRHTHTQTHSPQPHSLCGNALNHPSAHSS